MRKVLITLLLSSFLVLSSCGSSPLNLLTGGGPNVAANVQAGKTNTQTVGTTQNIAPSVSVRPNSRVENIDQSVVRQRNDKVETQVINETPMWMIVLLVLGWLLPSPGEIARWFRNLFKSKKNE